MGYRKVTEIDVFKKICFFCTASACFYSIGQPKYITESLRTSRYQVNKHIKALKEKGMIEYKSIHCPDEYEIYPPINGYIVTEKGKKSLIYKKEENEENKRLERAFL